MKSEWRLFGLITLFCFVVAPLYAWWTWYDSNPHVVEWVGTVGLILVGLLTAMCAGFFLVVSRRIDARPEDRPDAEIDEGAGDLGFFSPGSYYPFGIALATIVAGIGLVYLYWWMIALGLVGVLFGAAGLLFEYYTGARKAH